MKSMSVLFVCMGNICRSPTAHGIFRRLVEKKGLVGHIKIDSAGTHSVTYNHAGDQPDLRSTEAAMQYGIDITDLESRQFVHEDFKNFDYIIVMDRSNYQFVMDMARDEDERAKVNLLTDYLADSNYNEVPDPYFVGQFNKIYELIHEGCIKLLESIEDDKD